MPRYELPPDLTPEEERAVLAALEEVLSGRRDVAPWAMAGRVDALRLGALQVRHELRSPWPLRAHAPFARRGTHTLMGRGDAK